MLEKMGWNEGEGLGREGGGRREPVSVLWFAQIGKCNESLNILEIEKKKKKKKKKGIKTRAQQRRQLKNFSS